MYKGADRTTVGFKCHKNNRTGKKQKILIDEVKQYLDCRYISSIEAVYRLLEYPIHDRYPSVQVLHVHLPNRQWVTFGENSTHEQIKQSMARQQSTTLTAWFDMNKIEVEMDNNGKLNKEYLGVDDQGNIKPAASELYYHQFPKYYRWLDGKKKWKRRTNPQWQLGRMHTAHPSHADRWYLRILLNQVRGIKIVFPLF